MLFTVRVRRHAIALAAATLLIFTIVAGAFADSSGVGSIGGGASWPISAGSGPVSAGSGPISAADGDCASGASTTACEVSVAANGRANLVVRKSVSATAARPGDTLTWTITIQNTGSAPAAGIEAADEIGTLLAHGSFLGAGAGGALSGSSVRWHNLRLDPGAAQALSFAVRLDTTGWPSGTTTLSNTVVVPNSDCAAGSSNPACRVSTTVSATARLIVMTAVSASTAAPGDTLTYTITVQNAGSVAATGIEVDDEISTLLARGAFVSASAGGALSAATVRWSSLTLPPGAVQDLTFAIRLNASGWPSGTTTLANTVVVAGSNCDAGSADGACRVSTSVTTRTPLVVTKTVSAASAEPGDSLTYTITARNPGDTPATGVDVTDDIGALLTHGSFVSATNGGALAGDTVRWDDRTIGPGTTQSFAFTVRLDLGGWGSGSTSLRNTVVVAGSDCASGSPDAACRVATSVKPRYAVSIAKSVSSGSTGPWLGSLKAAPGATAWFRVRVTNAGNATLTSVGLRDSPGIPGGQCTAIPKTLSPGASWTCVYFSAVGPGTTSNTATVDTAQTGPSSGTATIVATAVAAPAIRLSKTATPGRLPIGGGNVTYTYAVINPGNVPLSGVTVTDDRCRPLTFRGGDADRDGRLDAGETWTYTCAARLTATVMNTARASGAYGSTRVAAIDKVTVAVLVGQPALHLEKTASPTQLAAGGGTATYTYLVTNVGNAPLTGVSVADDHCAPVRLIAGDSNGNGRLDLAEAWQYTCSAALTATTTNRAVASARFGASVVSDADEATVGVTAPAPAIRVVTAANPAQLPPGGGAVTFTYVVTNDGNVPLSGVDVTDDGCSPVTLAGGDTNADGRLDLAETWSFRCTADLAATTTTTVTAIANAGSLSVSGTAQATVLVTATNAAINLVKTAGVTTLPAGGGPVTYTYIVTNKGNVPLSNVSVVDDRCPTVMPLGGDTNGDGRLDLAESWTYTCSQQLTATTTNTALATGFANGSPVTDTDSALVTVGSPTTSTPRIGLMLAASPVVLPDTGGSVTYTYTVANKGDVALSDIAVTDDTCSPIGLPSGDANGDGRLDPAETWTFICVRAVTRTTASTATVSGRADGQTVTATDMATVTLTPPAPTPTPAPTASPSPTVAPTATSPGGTPSGPGGSGALPSGSGSVEGATSPPKASGQPGESGTVTVNTGTTPSGMLVILVVLLGIAAAVLIMALGRRGSNA